MKNSIKVLGAALLALSIYSCKDKNSFSINGELKNPGNVKKIYLLAADTNRITVVDSTNLSEDGKFTFKRSNPYPNIYKMRIGGTVFDLIAENGQEITFKTDLNDNSHLYSISGSMESVKIQEFNQLSNGFMERSNKISAAYQAAAQKLGRESDSLAAQFIPQYKQVQDEYSTEVIKFIRNNEAQLAAFYAATTLDQNKYERQLIAYADDLGKDDFNGNPAVVAFKKAMAEAKPLSVGHEAPDFTIGSMEGKPIKLSDYSGKYVMLDFWASWCGPCVQEMPNVVKQYAAFKDKGLNILGISLDEDKAAWQGAVKRLNMSWPQASDLKKWEGPTEMAYRIMAIPSNFIVGPDGKIVAKNLTGPELEDFLKKTFSK